MIRFTLFGHFRATLGGAALSFPTRNTAALAAYLLLERTTWQPRERIVPLLWPDTLEAKGRRNLRQTLLRLRQTLPEAPGGAPPILVTGDALRWNPAYPVEVDVYRFEAAMAQAEPYLDRPPEQTPYVALPFLQEAVDLYAGDLLLGFDLLTDFYAAWLEGWRTRYRRQALLALARLAAAYGRAGLLRHMERLARRQLALDAEHETAHQQLMQAYLAQGEYRAAMRHYADYAEHLAAYGEHPPLPLRMLFQRAQAYREKRVAPLAPIPHNLPEEPTPFFGRWEERDDLALWLASSEGRLLTLTGLGGMGKTRLALATARLFTRPLATIPSRFPGGVWFVPLSEVREPGDVPLARAVLEACGWQTYADETAFEAVSRHLRGEASLLVLDNLEHLPAAGEFIWKLLRAAPRLTVLATSRKPLGLHQETVRKLHGLPLPAGEHDVKAPSLRLLVDRLRRVAADFRPTPEVMPALLRICHALDGWPLALELAAGWAERLPVDEIARQVVTNPTALRTTRPDARPRHRSMQAVLQGSYALLSPKQQRVFTHFAVFRGGCTREAAEVVLGATPEDLTLLVRRALLRHQDGRYTMHELVRQFAWEQMTSEEQEEARRRHAHYYLGWLASQQNELYGPHPFPAVQRLRLEWDNLQGAWRWAVAHARHDLWATALPAWTRLLFLTGRLHEGEALLEAARTQAPEPLSRAALLAQVQVCNRLAAYGRARALLESLPPPERLAPPQRVAFHLQWGVLLFMQGAFAASRGHYLQALALARALGDRSGEAEILAWLLEMDYETPELDAEANALLEAIDDLWLKRALYSALGAANIRRGRYREAVAYWQKALEMVLELEDGGTASVLYNNLGDAWRELGEWEQSEEAFQKALELSHAFRFEAVQKNILEGWARLCVLRGEYERALDLAREAVALAAASGERHVEAFALATLGHAYCGLQRWAQAEQAYRQAVERLPEAPYCAEGLAGLAYVRWKQGDDAGARRHLRRFLDLLARKDLVGFGSPTLSYRRVAEVLKALGEDKNWIRAFVPRHTPLSEHLHSFLEE